MVVLAREHGQVTKASLHTRLACNFITKTAARRSEYRMTAQQCLRHPWLLGEGDIGDPITMGDMIASFSNMQNLARISKGIFLLRYLVNVMSERDAVVHIILSSATRLGEETDRDRGNGTA